jgi:hypothetical protein
LIPEELAERTGVVVEAPVVTASELESIFNSTALDVESISNPSPTFT